MGGKELCGEDTYIIMYPSHHQRQTLAGDPGPVTVDGGLRVVVGAWSMAFLLRQYYYYDTCTCIYRMARLLSALPVRKDMEKLLNYYFSNMHMSTSVRR